jgi:putative long chain acyl-CoA synthase
MDLSPSKLARSAGRLGATARNMVEVTFRGGLEVDEESSPYEVVARQRVYRLRRYFLDRAQAEPDRIPIILVPPLMLTAEVYDVSQATSAVRILSEQGLDPWVVDFGSPEHEEGGLTRTLTDHVL